MITFMNVPLASGGKSGFCGDVSPKEGGEWGITCRLPKPVSSPAATMIGNPLYVAGGWDGRMDEDKNLVVVTRSLGGGRPGQSRASTKARDRSSAFWRMFAQNRL